MWKCTAGQCYLDTLMSANDQYVHLELLRVVHGYPLLYRNGAPVPGGVRLGHAWLEAVENGSIMFIDVLKDFHAPREVVYRIGQIDRAPIYRYTVKDALLLAVQTGHAGPWEEEFPGAVFEDGPTVNSDAIATPPRVDIFAERDL